jgi:hypothetical protein
MRYFLLLLLAAAVASCAHRDPVAPVSDQVPFDQRLTQFAAYHNSRQTEALRNFFTKDATVQSPVTPRSASASQFLSALAAEPYTISFSNTETIYSLPGKAVTRSAGAASSPGKFNLKETVTVDWRLEDGYWRIARLRFVEWPSIIGTWRHAGLRGEGSIELRVLPGGTYVVYVGDDYAMPAFRGRYRLEGNRITFADTGADNPRDFQPGEGVYSFVRAGNGVTLQKVEDANTWRTERFDGAWSAR